MDISVFETKLKGLLDEISNLPSVQSHKPLLLTTKKGKTALKSDALEESLEHLQLIVKYLLFDVEATRRENQYLRKVLEDKED
jgi:hypothetical protein